MIDILIESEQDMTPEEYIKKCESSDIVYQDHVPENIIREKYFHGTVLYIKTDLLKRNPHFAKIIGSEIHTGNISVTQCNLKHLNWLPSKEVHGNLNVGSNPITSLNGLPSDRITGTLSLSKLQISKIDASCADIGALILSNNALTTIEGLEDNFPKFSADTFKANKTQKLAFTNFKNCIEISQNQLFSISAGGLGLLLCENLSGIGDGFMKWNSLDARLSHGVPNINATWVDILNFYLYKDTNETNSAERMYDCQQMLIERGFEDHAIL